MYISPLHERYRGKIKVCIIKSEFFARCARTHTHTQTYART